MALPPRRYDGFLPGRHPIAGFGGGGFRFAEMSHQGSILVLPSGIHAVSVPAPFSHDASLYAPVLAEAREVDILLVGTGPYPLPMPDDVIWLLRDASVRADVMTTASACGTYNVLLEEGRRVAALLAAVS